ncbi:MAG TPA: hypothetical protein PLA82_10175, partial [Deltaproteobacteria bacterium]|nr:hypothetical protein [Deltaproteobacteria bacterium]
MIAKREFPIPGRSCNSVQFSYTNPSFAKGDGLPFCNQMGTGIEESKPCDLSPGLYSRVMSAPHIFLKIHIRPPDSDAMCSGELIFDDKQLLFGYNTGDENIAASRLCT